MRFIKWTVLAVGEGDAEMAFLGAVLANNRIYDHVSAWMRA